MKCRIVPNGKLRITDSTEYDILIINHIIITYY